MYTIKNEQATGEICVLQNLALKNLNFLHFVCLFGPPGWGSGFVFPMLIRIQPTKMNEDPGPDP
jgi:hypothetical protein